MSKKFLYINVSNPSLPYESETFESSDFINAYSGNAGEPIVTDAGGLIALDLIPVASIDHNDLTGLQGGTTAEYYHLTQAQHDTLTDGSNADGLHVHSEGQQYVVAAGETSTIGFPMFMSGDMEVSQYDNQEAAIVGVALSSEIAAASVRVAYENTIVVGVLSGLIAGGLAVGDEIYWSGTALTKTFPVAAGSFVYRVGICVEATNGDMLINVAFKKKNA